MRASREGWPSVFSVEIAVGHLGCVKCLAGAVRMQRRRDAAATAGKDAGVTVWRSDEFCDGMPALRSQEIHGGLVFAFDLLHGALPWRFFRAPAEESRAVTEAASGEVIELNFDHQPGSERLPLRGTSGAPAAGASGGFAREAGGLDQLLQFPGQGKAIVLVDRRGEADVIELAFVVVETQQERADQRLRFEIAEASDYAVGGALFLDLLHPGALAGLVGQIAALGDYAIESDSHVKPFLGDREICGRGRKADRFVPGEIFSGELFQFLAALFEGKIDERFAAIVD